MKKVVELPTICGVEGGLIVYCLDEQEPMVWPSHEGVQSLLKKFYQVPEIERIKKFMKLETYYKEKASTSQDQLKKQTRKAKEVKVGQFMLQIGQAEMIDDFNITKLDSLIWFGKTNITIIMKCMEYYKQVTFSSVGLTQGDVPLLPQPQGPTPATGQSISIGNTGVGDKDTFQYFPWQDWLKDNISANDIRDTGSSSLSLHIQQPIPSHNGNPSIVPKPRLARFAYHDSSCATTAPRVPMPPFGHDSSSSVLTANLELL
ncbi:hypothetical protein CXB51_014465 [Gossypium anomalum]|uniref:MADS-box domain-containing protein n=1 Tax=Gossypium anomalum TaxID=47600 RepID=A0A8J5YRL9_9ROSI|nr:hypothetical protein CXB51_014465 [Gossypium anomalum]